MGIQRVFVELLLHEHRYRPVQGKVLSIGRQSFSLPLDSIYEALAAHGLPPRPVPIEFANPASNEVTDRTFFAMFSDAELLALDISDYEGADIVHDMGEPIPRDLAGQFDFIVNGSCLDNMFDPAQALRNMSDLLAPGGRVLHFEWGNSHPAAYTQFSPDWFFDYYAINRFDDCKTYVLDLDDAGPQIDVGDLLRQLNRPQGRLWHFDPMVENSGQFGWEFSYIRRRNSRAIFCLAEKGAASTSERRPMQKYYRHRGNADYIAGCAAIRASPRPAFGAMPAVQRPHDRFSDFDVFTLVADWQG